MKPATLIRAATIGIASTLATVAPAKADGTYQRDPSSYSRTGDCKGALEPMPNTLTLMSGQLDSDTGWTVAVKGSHR
jgi:hypothetical protein